MIQETKARQVLLEKNVFVIIKTQQCFFK